MRTKLSTLALFCGVLIAATLAADEAYVADGSNKVIVIDTVDRLVLATIDVGGSPDFIAITSDGALVYVTNGRTGTLSIIDTSSKSVIATVSVGTDTVIATVTVNEPFTDAFSINDGQVWVGNNPDEISIIDVTSNTVVATIGSVRAEAMVFRTTSSLLPPRHLKGMQQKNDFGVVYERFNTLAWEASLSPGVTGYDIYRDDVFIETTSSLTFVEHDVPRGSHTYTVVAISPSGESEPQTITLP